MAKYLGIDYGAKRVGIAVSDDTGSIAFPKAALPNDRALLPSIIGFVRSNNVSVIVIGESKDKDGKDNAVMAGARQLGQALERELSVKVYFEPEYYSSVEARRDSETFLVDAKAAAIILNRYLERSKNDLSR